MSKITTYKLLAFTCNMIAMIMLWGFPIAFFLKIPFTIEIFAPIYQKIASNFDDRNIQISLFMLVFAIPGLLFAFARNHFERKIANEIKNTEQIQE